MSWVALAPAPVTGVTGVRGVPAAVARADCAVRVPAAVGLAVTVAAGTSPAGTPMPASAMARPIPGTGSPGRRESPEAYRDGDAREDAAGYHGLRPKLQPDAARTPAPDAGAGRCTDRAEYRVCACVQV
jgi:hypothetical protein